MVIADLFPHTLDGSLGTLRGVKERMVRLKERIGIPVVIYTPYITRPTRLQGIEVKPIPTTAIFAKVPKLAYTLSKMLFWNRFLGKLFIVKMVNLANEKLTDSFIKVCERDNVRAIQAEHDVTLETAIMAGKKLGVPVIASLHAPAPEDLVAAGVIKRGDEVFSKLQKLNAERLAQVDLICVVSEALKDYVINEYGLPKDKVIITPNGCTARVMMPSNGKRVHPRVVHAGVMSPWAHVDLFVKSIPYIRREIPNVEFYATERGNSLKHIKKLDKHLRTHLKYFWFPVEEDMFSFLSSCTVGVLPSKDDPSRRIVTSTKLFDYMSVGLPIVANNVGEWSKIIQKEGIGLLTDDDPENFAVGIMQLLFDEDLRRHISEKELKLANGKYSWDRAIEPLVQAYKSLI